MYKVGRYATLPRSEIENRMMGRRLDKEYEAKYPEVQPEPAITTTGDDHGSRTENNR